MKLLVIGASKGIGLETVKAALDAGHAVRAFSRSAGGIALDHPLLEKMDGDATSAEDVARALDGVDAVAMTLGIKESIAMLWQKVTLFSDATRVLLPLMEAQGPDRLICVTGIAAGDSVSALSRLERMGHSFLLGEPYKDKTRQEEMIRASTLRWTLARPTILTHGPRTGSYKVLTDPKDWRLGLISRADVADYVVRALDDPAAVGAAPVLAR
ncbi:NAD(P)-dependent oxidoreductase [Aestuariicoccus sp. MJ-SS9]|uniref:NAD(P)-dependent oxidoreductase n=1 Tax=Aestuariicoccus sp. MJ-SS9 TaxID=3079855 RepID=UPI00290CAE4D|nr:NAD(P)H-binding protein [Aestuariicoccus sp. MJ-SS9]MDU8912813.1 NAD(P)H-binding protein [Aestuariicoccus sp. MJ-SS9]